MTSVDLYPQKGVIQVGSDADLVLVDTETLRRVRAEDLLSTCDFTLFQDWELGGWPDMTMLRGQIAYQDGELVGKLGIGRYVARTS